MSGLAFLWQNLREARYWFSDKIHIFPGIFVLANKTAAGSCAALRLAVPSGKAIRSRHVSQTFIMIPCRPNLLDLQTITFPLETEFRYKGLKANMTDKDNDPDRPKNKPKGISRRQLAKIGLGAAAVTGITYVPALLSAQEPLSIHSSAEEFSIGFSPKLTPDQITSVIKALAEYYRACGGTGFEIEFLIALGPSHV